MTSSVMTRRPRRLASDDEAPEILHGPEIGIDGAVVGDVVAVVAAGRRIERQQPQRGDAEVLQIVELFGQPGEIADAVIVAVGEGLDVQLIDDGVLVPELVAVERGDRQLCGIDGGRPRSWPPLTPGSERASAGSRSGSMRSRMPPHSTAIALAGDQVLDGGDVAALAVDGRSAMSPSGNQNSCGSRDSAIATATAVGLVDRFLDKADDVAVVDRMKRRLLVCCRAALARRTRLSSRDIGLDVAGLVPIPHLDLVFFGIEIFFPARDRLVLQQFEAVVDAVSCRTASRPARRAT